MSFLSNIAWSKLTELPHPQINQTMCYNRHRFRLPCHACEELCPVGIIGRNGAVENWNTCKDCGLCVSACKSRAITISEEQLNQLVRLQKKDEPKLWFGCDSSQRRNDLIRGCIGDIPWEFLAIMALQKEIILDVTPCAECANQPCRDLLQANVEQLAFFFGAERFARQVHLAKTEDDYPYEEHEVSRRGLFQQAATVSKKGSKELLKNVPLLSVDKLQLDGLSSRKLLHSQMKQEDGVFYWKVPKFTETCYGCERCMRRCPTGALRVADTDHDSMVVVDTWKCVGCDICQSSCTLKGVSGLMDVQIRDFSPLCLLHFQKRKCSECGTLIRPTSRDGLCVRCRQRIMMQKRKERNEQRLKEQEEKVKKE